MEYLPSYKDSLYLEHHGVLGQKWGIRRYQNTDGSLTSAGKIHYGSQNKSKGQSTFDKAKQFAKDHKKEIITGAAVVASALAIYGGYKLYKNTGYQPSGFRSYSLYEPLSKHINDYSSSGATIRKGSNLQRVSAEAVENLTGKGHVYVSNRFRDNMAYKSGFRREANVSGKTDFVHRITPKRDVKVASPKEAAKVYLDLFPEDRDDVFRMVASPYSQNDAFDSDPISKMVSNKRRKFVSELTKRGFDGMVDIEDSTKRKGSAPMILFNPDSYASVKSSHKIGAFETFIADLLK